MSSALVLLAVYLGGVLTILSPCILPVLPFVLTRTGRPFARETLPMLLGLALTFVAVASAGTASAAWVAGAFETGRWVALLVLATAAVALLSPRAAAWLSRPAVQVGARVLRRPPSGSPGGAVVVGVATGLLWAPCAGPVLGLVIAAAASGATPSHAALLFAVFALGAATSLAVGLLAGARLQRALRRRVAGVRVRQAVGALALAAVALLALGWDASLLSRGGFVQTASAEEALIHRLVPSVEHGAGALPAVLRAAPPAPPVPTPDEGPLPTFRGATGWLNAQPLTPAQLRGRVVLVNVWTFACYNCLNALPHIQALEARYRERGLLVVGVHTPELARERLPSNVADAVRRLKITYPVVLDNDFTIWRAFANRYWPSVYIADRQGRLRFHHFGEGRYDDEERVIQQLLAEPDPTTTTPATP